MFPKAMRYAIGKDRGWVCQRCGRRWKDGWLMEVHHKLPTLNGGRDTPENAEILCIFCHAIRHKELVERGLSCTQSIRLIEARIERTGGRWKK